MSFGGAYSSATSARSSSETVGVVVEPPADASDVCSALRLVRPQVHVDCRRVRVDEALYRSGERGDSLSDSVSTTAVRR